MEREIEITCVEKDLGDVVGMINRTGFAVMAIDRHEPENDEGSVTIRFKRPKAE